MQKMSYFYVQKGVTSMYSKEVLLCTEMSNLYRLSYALFYFLMCKIIIVYNNTIEDRQQRLVPKETSTGSTKKEALDHFI